MTNITRRQALAGSGFAAAMINPISHASAVGNTLTIAYNVNVPSFDPTKPSTLLH